MAQLKGKGTVSTASSGQKSALVMWRTIEIDSTIPWVGGWRGALVGGGRRKEGRKQRSLGPPEKGGLGSLRGQGWEPHFLAPWGEGAEAPSPRPPGAGWGGACLSHQLTMGSTSASRSKSSWVSSVLPESLLATELGDGEFLEG